MNNVNVILPVLDVFQLFLLTTGGFLLAVFIIHSLFLGMTGVDNKLHYASLYYTCHFCMGNIMSILACGLGSKMTRSVGDSYVRLTRVGRQSA